MPDTRNAREGTVRRPYGDYAVYEVYLNNRWHPVSLTNFEHLANQVLGELSLASKPWGQVKKDIEEAAQLRERVREYEQEATHMRERVIRADARIAELEVRLRGFEENPDGRRIMELEGGLIRADSRIAELEEQLANERERKATSPSLIAIDTLVALQQQLNDAKDRVLAVFERYVKGLENHQTQVDSFDETIRQLTQEISRLNERNHVLSDTWESHKAALDKQAARIQEQDQQIRRQQDEIDGLMALRKNEAEISRRSAELHIGRTRRCSDCGGIHTEHTLMCPLLLEAMQKSSGMTATEALKYPGLQSDAVLDTARPTYQPGDQMTATDVMKAQIAEEHAKPSKTFERVRPEQCDHEWIGHQNPNTPDGPGETVEYCDKCGDEKGGE